MGKRMNTVNIVLGMVLCAMIGFAIGNVWGRETMKRIFEGLLDQMTKNLDTINSGKTKGE